jgi:epoxyqueuosine reductase QueG
MNNIEIKNAAYESGADICGIASIERFSSAPAGFHPSDIYKDTKSVAVFARRLPKGAVCTGNPLTYSISENIVTDQIRNITYNFSLLLEDKGVKGVPVYTEPYAYWDKDTMTGKGDLSLKHAGYLAGIGVFGRNHLLYNYKYGNLIKLGAMLINIEVAQDEIQSFTFCKDSCLLCLKNCPSGALETDSVVQKKCRNHSESLTVKGYPVTTCNSCRTICPYSYGISRD